MAIIRKYLCITAACSVVTMITSCSRDENKPLDTASPHTQGIKKETTVVVPPSTKGKWKAVIIGVTDKTTSTEILYDVPIGSRLKLPGSTLTIMVENFLPAFTMHGATLTTESNELKNPAAQVRVYDNEKEIFKGWLFTLYPNTHAFQHPRYGFSLKDFIANK